MFAIQHLRESLKRALRVCYGVAVRRFHIATRHADSSHLTRNGERPVPRIEPKRLPDLGYDQSTIDWVQGLLRDGNPTAPFPTSDGTESQSDALRLRGVFAYMCQLDDFVESDVIDARLAVLIRSTLQSIRRNPGIGWDTTNAALRLLSLLEGVESLSRDGRDSAIRKLLPQRFLVAHSRVLSAGAFIEPRGNHEALNVLGFAALDMLLQPRTGLSERRLQQIERVLVGQILSDGGHVERCPYYHMQVVSTLNAILAANARRGGMPAATLVELHRRLLTALRAMVVPSAGVPARFGDISRLWSGRRAEEEVKRALGTSWSVDTTPSASLPDFGLIRTSWRTRGRHMDLVADTGTFGLAGNAGHAHDDCLSYCLYIDGIEIVADPGVFRYADDPVSIWFKLAGAHNTIRWANAPGPVARRFFRWHLAPLRENVTVSGSPGTAAIRARRRAYCRGSGHVSHVRTWTPMPEGLVVEDRVMANRHDPCIARVNVGPRCRLELDGHREALVLLDGRVPCLRVGWRAPAGIAVSRASSRYAAQYGEITTSEALEWSLPRGRHGSRIEVRFEPT